jgi:hypothetical protein
MLTYQYFKNSMKQHASWETNTQLVKHSHRLHVTCVKCDSCKNIIFRWSL